MPEGKFPVHYNSCSLSEHHKHYKLVLLFHFISFMRIKARLLVDWLNKKSWKAHFDNFPTSLLYYRLQGVSCIYADIADLVILNAGK